MLPNTVNPSCSRGLCSPIACFNCWTNPSPLVMQSLKMVLISCQRLGNLERGLEESLKHLLPFLLYEANLLSSFSGCPFLCHPGPISALLFTSMPWIYLWFLSTFNLTSPPLEKPESSCLPWEIVPMNFKAQLESHLLLEPFPKHLSLSPSALLQHPGWYFIYFSLSLFLITRILCVYLISPTRLWTPGKWKLYPYLL